VEHQTTAPSERPKRLAQKQRKKSNLNAQKTQKAACLVFFSPAVMIKMTVAIV
jgi:hypothetical protein